jgi:hypothetical protein
VAAAVLAAAGATEADFFQGKRGIFGYVQKGTDLLDPAAGPNTYVKNTLADDKWYSGKIKTAADKMRVDAVKAPLTELVEAIEKLRATYLPQYALLAGMQPYLFHASLLSELNKLVEANKPRAQRGFNFGIQPAHCQHCAHGAGAFFVRAAGRTVSAFAD